MDPLPAGRPLAVTGEGVVGNSPGPCVLTLIGRQSTNRPSVRTQLRTREAQTVDTSLVTTPWLPTWLTHW